MDIIEKKDELADKTGQEANDDLQEEEKLNKLLENTTEPGKFSGMEKKYQGISFATLFDGRKENLFDKRIAERQIEKNCITAEDYKKYQDALPDVSDNVGYLTDEQLEEYDKIADRIQRIISLKKKGLATRLPKDKDEDDE